MSYKSRSRKLDYPLHGQSLSSQAAENHFQSLRSQVFNKQGGGQQGNSSSNSSSSSGPIRCLAWNGPGSRVACGYYDRSVKVWMPDHPDGHGMTDIKNAHDRPVESISWDPTHADRVVSCASDGTIKAWDARAKTLLAETRNGHDNLVVRFSGDGRFLAVATAKTDLIIIYRVRRPQKESGVTWGIEYLCQFRENEEIYDLQWAENGSDTTYVLASGLGNGNVRIYRFDTIDVNTEKARTNPSSDEDLSEAVNKLANVYTLRGHRTAANCLNFDPKGKYLAVGSNEGIVSLWDLQNFICIKTFFKTDQAISSLSITHDGTLIAVGSEGNTPIDIIHVESGKYLHSLPRQPSNGRPIVSWHPFKYTLAYIGDPSVLMIFGGTSSGHRS